MVKNEIALLSKDTIDKIAAGEVVERPASVVKELVENAIDAGATAVTVEIKNGGTTFIRITDNGCGIEKSQIPLAFLRHSTSKITCVEDLDSIRSLGFRGEALSSISAVARVELITKTKDELTAIRYVLEGAQEISLDEIGAPTGTTFIITQLFYNTPARKKFLKSPATEGSYISDLMERMAFSHPEVAFRLIHNGTEKLNTTGSGNLKDVIYQIYGRDITNHLLEIHHEFDKFSIDGFIGKPIITRGNRNFETFFVQKRYIKSTILSKALEDGYKGYLMQHQYPFAVLHFSFHDAMVDVNVHPTKQEVRFEYATEVYENVRLAISERLSHREQIETVPMTDVKEEASATEKEEVVLKGAEPFETNHLEEWKKKIVSQIHEDTPYEKKYTDFYEKHKQDLNTSNVTEDEKDCNTIITSGAAVEAAKEEDKLDENYQKVMEQISFLTPEAKEHHKIIGQLFDTYWLVEYEDKLYIIDQHAAHEKVLFERTMATLKTREMTSQMISPPIVVSLSYAEQEVFNRYRNSFEKLGYQIQEFGGKEYAICAVPDNLFSVDTKELFMEMLAGCQDFKENDATDIILEKVASMSCKAAVKGNNKLSRPEIEALIDELLSLDNPFHCPHGRPTIIAMSKYDIEKKFKRIV